MARWVLITFVALLISWLPTNWQPSASATPNPLVITIIPRTEPVPQTLRQSLLSIRYGHEASMDQCEAQPTILWCAGYRVFELPLASDTLKSTDATVRANFTYLAEERDSWRVHTQEVISGKPWQGDCDDLATTALDMMARVGQPLDRMWLVLVAATTENKLDGRLDHLIAVVQDSLGGYWVVGDTSGKTVELKDMKYRPLVFMSPSDRIWRGAEIDDAFATHFGVPKWTLGQGQPRLQPGSMRPLP